VQKHFDYLERLFFQHTHTHTEEEEEEEKKEDKK
jgi:hypothetical protein